jgi:hypothetical protein
MRTTFGVDPPYGLPDCFRGEAKRRGVMNELPRHHTDVSRKAPPSEFRNRRAETAVAIEDQGWCGRALSMGRFLHPFRVSAPIDG